MDSSPNFRLGLFGSPVLLDAHGDALTGRAGQRHRLALLALLARAPDSGVSRDLLMAYLWPESDLEQARNLLKVSVYVLRRALGEAAIVSAADALHLAGSHVEVDVVAFEEALARGDDEGAVALHRGPFMEGFSLKGAHEFGLWLDRERAALADSYARALERLAEGAESEGDATSTVEWWKKRAAHDPYDSRIAVRLMRALAAAGSPAGAVQHAAIHGRLLRDELGVEPAPEIAELLDELRREPPPALWRRPPAVEPLPKAPVGEEERQPALPSPASHAARRLWPIAAGLALTSSLFVLAARLWPGPSPAPDTRSSPALAVLDPARPPTASVAAWELYRRASQPEVLRSDSAAREGLGLLRQAVELDPSFAGAHAGVARMYLRIGPPDEPDMPRRQRLLESRRHAVLATRLDGSLAEAHATLGIADMALYDFASADEHLRRALELDPSDTRSREWLVQLYVGMGRYADALTEGERAFRDDPLSATARAELARALMVNGRCAEALALLEALADLDPPLLRAGVIAAECLAENGRWDEAIASIRQGLPRSGVHGKANLGHFLARAGRTEEAESVLREVLDVAGRGAGEAFWVATVYAGLGRFDEAFLWLDRSIDEYSFREEIMEPMFADVRADARFEALLERVGLSLP